MIDKASVLASIFSIFFILGLKMDQAKGQNEIDNIRKVLTLIRDYQKGYDYHRKNTFAHRDKKPAVQYTSTPEPSMEDKSLDLDFDYIRAQAKYGTFSELHSIFTAQIFAMIYALKLRERLHSQPAGYRVEQSWLESSSFYYLTKFGIRTDYDPIPSAILRILKHKHPKSCKQFEQISDVFGRFQLKMKLHVLAVTREHERSNSKFLKELHREAKILVEYIMVTFLRLRVTPQLDNVDDSSTKSATQSKKKITDKDSTGLGIDVNFDLKTLPIDTRPLHELTQQDPNRLYVNSDDTSKENMFRSTAMNILEGLIEIIAKPRIGAEGLEELQPIASFFLVRPWGAEGANTFAFIEISYIDMRNMLYPEAVSDSNENTSEIGSFFYFS